MCCCFENQQLLSIIAPIITHLSLLSSPRLIAALMQHVHKAIKARHVLIHHY